MKDMIVIVTVLGFVWLSYVSLHREQPARPVILTQAKWLSDDEVLHPKIHSRANKNLTILTEEGVGTLGKMYPCPPSEKCILLK